MPVDNSPRPSGAHRPAGSSGGGVSKALIALIAALVVGALVVLGIWLFGQDDDDELAQGASDSASSPGSSEGSEDGASLPAGAAVPQGLDAEPTGVTVGEAGGPELTIFEDFQCPACKDFEDMLGEDINQRVDDGEVQVTYFPMTFLDGNIPGENSERATSAAYCALDQGRYREYHDIVFENQPQEGQGFEDAQLKDFGEQAGIEGDALSTFETCVDEGTYREYARASNARAGEIGVNGTPTVYLNGQRMELSNQEDFVTQVDEAGAPQTSDATPSAS